MVGIYLLAVFGIKGEVLGMGSSEAGEITVTLRNGWYKCIDFWASHMSQPSRCEWLGTIGVDSECNGL